MTNISIVQQSISRDGPVSTPWKTARQLWNSGRYAYVIEEKFLSFVLNIDNMTVNTHTIFSKIYFRLYL